MNWIRIINDEIKAIASTEKDLKSFGNLIGGILLILGLVSLFSEKEYAYSLLLSGAVIILFRFIYPKAFLPIQKAWMMLAVILGFFMTRVILILLFGFVFLPIKLVATLFGKNFLDTKIDKSTNSYWNYRDNKEYEKIFTERQF